MDFWRGPQTIAAPAEAAGESPQLVQLETR
jgi:hypothetical protein